MKFIEKNIKIITLIILIMFFFKSCQSCSRGRECSKMKVLVDSIETIYRHDCIVFGDSIKTLNDKISFLEEKVSNDSAIISIKNEQIGELKNDKNSLRKSNATLITHVSSQQKNN